MAAHDLDAAQQIQSYADRDWLEKATHDLLTWTIPFPNIQYKVKKGVILDFKRSGVSKRTRKTRRVVLARLANVVRVLLEAFATKETTLKTLFWNSPMPPGNNLWRKRRGATPRWPPQGSTNGPW